MKKKKNIAQENSFFIQKCLYTFDPSFVLQPNAKKFHK